MSTPEQDNPYGQVLTPPSGPGAWIGKFWRTLICKRLTMLQNPNIIVMIEDAGGIAKPVAAKIVMGPNSWTAILPHVAAAVSSGGGGGLAMFHFKQDAGNYLVCVTWDGTTEGTEPVNIAKRPKLRTSLATETIEGIVYNYTYTPVVSGGITVSYTRNTTGGATQTDKVTPPYLLNDIVLAMQLNTGLLDASGDSVDWQDMSERAWGKQ
jgi:hypothetical protein